MNIGQLRSFFCSNSGRFTFVNTSHDRIYHGYAPVEVSSCSTTLAQYNHYAGARGAMQHTASAGLLSSSPAPRRARTAVEVAPTEADRIMVWIASCRDRWSQLLLQYRRTERHPGSRCD